MLEKDSPENGDQAKNYPSMKDNEVSATDTSPSILQTIQMMQRENTATSNIDNLDHIISMIAKSTMKYPRDVNTSFRVEGQVPCASNIEDQEDKNTEFFVLNTGEDMEIINERSKPPHKNGDALVDAFVDASGDAICVGDASEDMHVGGDANCAGGAIGASVVGAVGASAAKYVRHNDGIVPHPWEDGGDARGVAGYVRNDDGTVSRPWEDPRNILFESKPAIILDINSVLLTLVDKRYSSQLHAYWSGLEIVEKAGVFAGWILNKDSGQLRIPYLQTDLGRVLHRYAAQIHPNRLRTAWIQGQQTHEVGESSRPPQTEDEIFRTQLVTAVAMFTQVMQNPRFMAFLQPLPQSQTIGNKKSEPAKAQPQVIHTTVSMETPVHLPETMQSPNPVHNVQEQVAGTPVLQAARVQPATFQQPLVGLNGQGSDLQAMQQSPRAFKKSYDLDME
ncbi:hypothetical protein L7F22_007967 [Adiantum nelumboides]|nr:hypothetical protein [Adiantum nelumboides]